MLELVFLQELSLNFQLLSEFKVRILDLTFLWVFNILFIKIIFFLMIKSAAFWEFIYLFETLNLLIDGVDFLIFGLDDILECKYVLFDGFIGLLLFEMF